MPAYDLCVLGDTAFAPYGTKKKQAIRERTFACLERLFAAGCELVILACNTASTAAIVERQTQHPEKKVLSITVPGVEEVRAGNYAHIGILATQLSVTTNLYPHMFYKHRPDHALHIEQVVGE